jgi:iron complex transport system substrate-binding protein
MWKAIAVILPALFLVAARAEEPSKRIVSMAPSITETLFALGLGEEVVGVSDFCEYPPAAKEKARVGGFLNPDMERILALRPDLVVMLPNEIAVKKLRGHGIRVVVTPNNSIKEVLESFVVIGRATGREGRAKELVERIKSKSAEVRKLVEKAARPRVLFVVGTDPIFAAGKGSFLDELVRVSGGKNVLEESKVPFPQLSMESVLSFAPEVIIDSTVVSAPTKKAVKAQNEKWSKWKDIPAVRDGRVYVLKDNRDIVPGPRLPEAIDDLLKMIHPELKLERKGTDK